MLFRSCLDTNGYALHYDEVLETLLDHTDLVMLDLKQIDPDIHRMLVGIPNTRTLAFAQHLARRKQKTRVRYVVVPGYTDDDRSAHLLGRFIAPMDNVDTVEILPYHELGAHKWALCGDDYKEVPPNLLNELKRDRRWCILAHDPVSFNGSLTPVRAW